MNKNFKGKFIVIDGPDGCGKSTQVGLLTKWLQDQNVQVCTYRDPGTTEIGEKIRQILLDPDNEGMGDNVEVMLYMAARAQLWKERISPDLSAGKCVLMDRWISSTCAYQGCAGGFGIDKVIQIGKDTLERVWPNITIILDVDVATAAKRMDRQLDRMEQKGDDYHTKVRAGFTKLAESYDKIELIDGREEIEIVHKNITQLLQRVIDP